MVDFHQSSARHVHDRWFAVGGSFVLHGMAVAAFIALAGGNHQDTDAPPTITVALEWSAPSNQAAANASAAEDAASGAVADALDVSMPRRDGAVTAPEVKPETETLVATSDGDMGAAPATTEPHRANAPASPSRAAAMTKPKANARSRPAKEDSPPAAIGQAADGPSAESPLDVAMERAAAAASAAADAGERTAWSVISRRPPAYPMSARRRGIQGDVSLHVDIGTDGRPRTVKVAQSSGDPQLDAAAARAVEQWRFAVAAPMTIEIPIVFRLNTNTVEAMQP